MDTKHTCPQGWDLTQLLAYVDGDLEDAARVQVEQHVKGCPFCADELESLRRMNELLFEHPEAFHPDVEELYRFVSHGADPSGRIAAHLESCDACSHDLELLREMISQPAAGEQQLSRMPQTLLERLGQSAVPQTQGVFSRLLSSMEELFRLPFRMPVLALGSAAAVLIVVVVCLPLWHSYRMEQYVDEFRVSERKRIASKMQNLKHREELGVHKDGAQGFLEKPMRQVSPKADHVRPAEPPGQAPATAPPAPLPEQSVDLRDIKSEASLPAKKAAPAKEAAGTLKPSPAAPPATLEAAPQSVQPGRAIVPDLRLQEQAPEKERHEKPFQAKKRSALGMSVPQPTPPAPHREARKDTATASNEPAKGGGVSIPVAVHVSDARGNPVPWLQVHLPPTLAHRFRLVSQGYNERDARQGVTSPSEGPLMDEKAAHRAALRIEVQVFGSDGAFDVVSKLFDNASGREIASLVALPKSREEVPGAVDAALRGLLARE
jgi:anti-sigma factor RsiW